MNTTVDSEAFDAAVLRVGGYVERLLRRRFSAAPDAVWLTFKGDRYSWRDTLTMTRKAANGLLAHGVAPGDLVAIMASNKPDFIWIYLGLQMIGARVVPLNSMQRGNALEHIIDDAQVSTIVLDPELCEFVLPLKKTCAAFSRCINFGEVLAPGCDACYADIMRGADTEPALETEPATSPVSIIYTSGTTGRPKGIVIDEDRFFYEELAAACDLGPGETMYCCLPLFHGNGLYLSVLGSMYLDAKLVLAEKFSASRFWEDCRRHDVKQINLLGSIVPILLNQPLSSEDRNNPVRAALSFGCPAAYWRAFEERFGVRVVECYSLSDSVGFMINRNGPVGSVGRPEGGMEFRVVDESDQPCGPGVVGEIVIRTPHGQATVYKNMPEETAKAYQGGWFHTGDLGEVDAEGWFYFRGRKKEMIRRKGENISIWEIEAAFRSHPAVEEVAAFSVAPGRASAVEEEIMVAIVAKEGFECEPADVLAYGEPRLARYAMPRYVEIVTALPKTATEKVQRNLLTERGTTDRTWDGTEKHFVAGAPADRPQVEK